MPIGWYIGISSGSILFLVAFFLLSCANYKKRFNTRYDLRNHFPYEFNFESHFSLNLLGNLALIMGIACSIGLFALTASEFNKNGYFNLCITKSKRNFRFPSFHRINK